MSKRRYVRVVCGLSLFGLLLGCGYMTAQDLSESFSSKTYPKVILSLANPEPVSKPEFLPAPAHSLRVAVIDNGVDYNHPLLRDRIAYDIEDGKIVGAGFDVLGNDLFAHPNKIDARTFAFGATLSSDKRIATYLENPIEKLDELNTDFMRKLTNRVSKEPALVKTFWSRINAENFTVMSAMNLLRNKEQVLKSYSNLKSMNVSYALDSKNKLPLAARDFYAGSVSALRETFDLPWKLSSNSSFDISNAGYYQGVDVFLRILGDVYTQFDRDTAFESKYVSPYAQFLEIGAKESSEALYVEWYKHKYPNANDPAIALVDSICSGLTDVEYANVKKMNDLEKEIFFTQAIEHAFNETDSFNQFVATKAQDASKGDIQNSRFSLRSSPKYKAWAKELIEERKIYKLLCDMPPSSLETLPFHDAYVAHAKKITTPYLDESSHTVSHASHVSGIIMAQDPMLTIFPVRVLTEGRETTKTLDQAVKTRFRNRFSEWLDQKDILAGVLSYLKAELGLNLTSKTQVMAQFDQVLPVFYEGNSLDILFIEQVVTGIKEVGKRKIKFANVSLGTTHDQYTAPGEEQEQLVSNKFHNLIIESWKHEISRALREDAPGTVFVIAAGNDGMWLDGKVKSALPCDLSSPLFKNSESGRQADNILCVGSTNEKNELSGFTNIPLTGIPLVFIRGQAVISSINSEDCSGLIYEQKLKMGTKPKMNLGLSEKDMEKYKTERKLPKNKSLATEYLTTQSTIMTNVIRAATTQSCITREPYMKGPMDGTSMASPAAAGTIARFALEKAIQMKKDENDIYLDPAFKPSALISEFLSTLPSMGSDTILQAKLIPETRTEKWIADKDAENSRLGRM